MLEGSCYTPPLTMAPDIVPPVRRISPAALLILLAAFALRAYRLDAQSLWYDEGLSVHLASLPLGETISRRCRQSPTAASTGTKRPVAAS